MVDQSDHHSVADGTPALRAQINELANEYINASNAADLAADKIREVQQASQRGAQSITDVFTGMATGALTAEQAVGRLIIQILKMSLQKRIMETAENSTGWISTAFKVIGGGFADGGYTGSGGKNDPAGIVHKGEYVLSKSATSAIGVGNLDALHSSAKRGYANGGYVGPASSGSKIAAAREQAAPSISISAPISVTGSSGTEPQNADLARQIGKQMEASMKQTVVSELQKQMRPGNMLNTGRR
jgi:phage-related minor tail protein